ncbi:MAG: hypothetical protein OHK93_004292 [Ramalina farinacea]|uniref:Nephrocystin 3-like N-terminal domain-containing protein n=1 Tax=Ramalina farinacea TaxID=258253 RepID=A0AA43QGH9_9LECA|nr:hypothetical protein [Ramalina farinacea]
MDPVTAFSLACGVIQVVSFSKDLVQMCSALYKQGSLTEHADIVSRAQHLRSLHLKLEDQSRIKEVSAVLQPIDNELLELAQKCSQTAQKLIDEIDKLKAPRRRNTVVIAVKIAFHHQGVLDKLQAQMDGHRRTLDTHVMIDLRRRVGLVLDEKTDASQKLDKFMQDITKHVAVEPMTCDQMAGLLQNHTSSVTESINQKLQTLDLSHERNLYCDKYLASLHFPEIHSRQEKIAKAHQETFKWIFDDSVEAVRPWANFVHWLKTESGIYWISGKAGSGKSTLMNYIQQDERKMEALTAWAGPKTIVCPSFFFWGAGSDLQRTVAGLLRSLLYQILGQFPDLIGAVGSSAGGIHEFEPIAAWTEQRLIDTLQQTTRAISPSCCVCLFIDGLDEFGEDHYVLIEMIQTLAALPAVKCCVSSRAESQFVKAFDSSSKLRLQDLTRSDIKTFVSAKLKDIDKMKVFLNQPKQRTLHPVDLIVEKADGVFLWVELAVKSQIIGIKNDDDIETLWRRLEDLPTEINDLYSCMLKRISKFYMKEAAQYFRLAHLLTSSPGSQARVLEIVLALHYTGDELYKRPDLSKLASEYDRATGRIDLTCAGLISCHGHEEDIAGDALDLSSRTALDCWLHCGKAKFTWCHRTARDFFNWNQPGANFVDLHTQYQSPEMVSAATKLAEVVFECLVAREPRPPTYPQGYRKSRLLSDVCYDIESAEITHSNVKEEAIEFVHHVDKCINHLCDWCGRTGDNFWQSVWTEIVARGTGTDDSSRPTDFFTFASSNEVYFHLEDRLDREGQSLSHSEIQHLAHCVGRTGEDWRWGVKSLRQLKLVTRLIQLGADANSSDAHSTIWEEALRYIYKGLNDMTYHDLDGVPTELASIVEIFLRNGANPYPVAHKARFYGRSAFDETPGVWLKIDLRLWELPTYRRILEKLITAGKVSQTVDTASRSFLPQIYIQGSRSVDPEEPDIFDLNDEIRPQIYALIDQVFNNRGSLDLRDQMISQIRAILPTKE